MTFRWLSCKLWSNKPDTLRILNPVWGKKKKKEQMLHYYVLVFSYTFFSISVPMWARGMKQSSWYNAQCVSYHEIFFYGFLWIIINKSRFSMQHTHLCKEGPDHWKKVSNYNISLNFHSSIKLLTPKYRLIVMSNQFQSNSKR